MAATVIDGKALAARVRGEVAEGVAEFAAQHGRPPGLATILIGEDPASAQTQGTLEELGYAPVPDQLLTKVQASIQAIA